MTDETNMPNYLDVASFNRKLGAFKRNEAKRVETVTELAMSALYHASRKQSQPATDLSNALGQRSDDGKSLVQWFTFFGPLTWGKGKKGDMRFVYKKDWDMSDFDLESAATVSPFGFVASRAPTTKGADKLFAELKRWSENKARKDSDVPKFTDDGAELAQALVKVIANDSHLAALVAKAG